MLHRMLQLLHLLYLTAPTFLLYAAPPVSPTFLLYAAPLVAPTFLLYAAPPVSHCSNNLHLLCHTLRSQASSHHCDAILELLVYEALRC